MRILQLCLSEGHGGLELHVNRLCALLRERGHDCQAVARPGTRLAGLLADQAVPLHLMKTRARVLPLVAATRLARLLERERIDVMHIHWAKDLPLAALAKRLCRRPLRLIHSRHMSITRPKHDAWHRFLYHSLDCYVVITGMMRDEALRYLPLDPAAIEVIPLGVAAPDPQLLAQTGAEPDDGVLKVGMFGRIEPLKGQHLLIDAVDRLHREGMAVRARIIGHAMSDDYLAQLQRDVGSRGLSGLIEFSGFHPEPYRLMPTFDVIVLATKRETFGLVLVEAMLCGVAVIGSDAGGVPEIIEHEQSGLLFEPESAASLAAQLERLARDPALRRRLAQAGRTRAASLFSEERHLAQIEALMARLHAPPAS